MKFIDRSYSMHDCVIDTLKEIDEIVVSNGFSEFSDKYRRSIGYPCFHETDLSLQSLWILVGGARGERENIFFRYLESDSKEPENCKLDCLSLGNVYAAGDPTLLKTYVSAYSLLLDIALNKIDGGDPILSDDQLRLISRFITRPAELACLGQYDPLSASFSDKGRKSLTTKETALYLGYFASEFLAGSVFSEPILNSLEKSREPNEYTLTCGRDDFVRLVFKTCFYERIVKNIYHDNSRSTQLSRPITLKVFPEGAKHGCIKRVSISGRSFEVSVPPGSKNGTLLKLKGVGANGADVLLALSIESIFGNVDFKSNSSIVYNDVASPTTLEFAPSAAIVPPGRSDISDNVASLFNSLRDQKNCIQSFFNDLVFSTESSGEISLLDGVLHVPPFDEALYASLVKEMHRYTLAELYDKRTEVSDKYSYVGAGIGAVIGLMTYNPLMPFAGGIYGRNFAPKGKKLEEILPDPHLLFQKDQSSFTRMTRSGSLPSKLRRLIFHRIVHANGSSYYRIIPAMVSSSAIIPMQIFRCSENAYFMRPVNAGIDINDSPSNYAPIKIQKQYYHLLGDGKFSDTGERMSIVGDDIDGHRYRIYRHSCDTRELDYFYIDYASDPSHVF